MKQKPVPLPQSVKAVALRGEHGVDVFKQTRGIKRHLLVDTLSFVIALAVLRRLQNLSLNDTVFAKA